MTESASDCPTSEMDGDGLGMPSDEAPSLCAQAVRQVLKAHDLHRLMKNKIPTAAITSTVTLAVCAVI